MNTEPLVYLRGQFLPASQASLKIYDSGIVMGATVTEMTRTFRHQPFRLEDHIARLFRSLKYTRMETGLTPESLASISRELLAHNASLIKPDEELGLIHFVTAGEYPVYAGSAAAGGPMTPTVCVHTFPLPFSLWSQRMKEGAHVVTPSIRHVPPQCFDPKMKYRSRMHYYLADQEARLVAPDAIALLLDLDGNVTETSGANFLLVQQGEIVSPTRRNILPGISRQTVIELARKLDIPFAERDLQVHDVMNADEGLLTSTPFCVMPVTRINGSQIADGKPGSIFRRLLEAWSEKVGLEIMGQFRC
ncbi:MAG: aminotransferase class IV [Pirellulaceae bacterium]|nr:aminotransferase class IV [Pirellulaceae bacterium]